MAQHPSSSDHWHGRRFAVTGAGGSLGTALTRALRQRGATVIGLTHRPVTKGDDPEGPDHWVCWKCGEEDRLDSCLADVDILVINHGFNPHGDQDPATVTRALEINALSSWRLMQRFERIAGNCPRRQPRELWVNTSEAEIQPAVSPAYELSKRLIGQLVSLRGAQLTNDQRQNFGIRKLVLGPFRSDMNPIGLMSAGFVAEQILFQASLGLRLIIVTPNPITFVLMPLSELGRRLYSRLFNRPDP